MSWNKMYRELLIFERERMRKPGKSGKFGVMDTMKQKTWATRVWPWSKFQKFLILMIERGILGWEEHYWWS